MKNKLFVIFLLTSMLFSCNNKSSNNSSSSVNNSFYSEIINSSLSSSSNGIESELTDKYGVTYINSTALRVSNVVDNTRIDIKNCLENNDFFSLKLNSLNNESNLLNGILNVENVTEENKENEINYNKEIITDTNSILEINYDVKAAMAEIENNNGSIKDFIDSIKNGNEVKPSSPYDGTEAYLLNDVTNNGYSLDDYHTHEKDINSHNMIYYQNPAFYYDLTNIGDITIPDIFTGKGKIDNFNFNHYFASRIISERDKAVDILSYSDVSEWPKEYRDATYIDELIMLYQYIVSDAVNDNEAIECLIVLQDPIYTIFGLDLGINEENKKNYIPLLQFFKKCSEQFLVFSEEKDLITISIDMPNLISFSIGLCNSLILNYKTFDLSEEDVEAIKSTKNQLLFLNSEDFNFSINILIDEFEMIKGFTYNFSGTNENATIDIASYSDGDISSRIDYKETFVGKNTFKLTGNINFSYSNEEIEITEPDLSSF